MWCRLVNGVVTDTKWTSLARSKGGGGAVAGHGGRGAASVLRPGGSIAGHDDDDDDDWAVGDVEVPIKPRRGRDSFAASDTPT